MPFSGVRISWLVLTGNALLARFAAAPLGHVLGDPDRAAEARVDVVHRLGQHAAPILRAVAPRQLVLDLEGLAGGEQGPGQAADLGVFGLARPDHHAALAGQRAGLPAGHALEARIRLDEAAGRA